MAGVARPRVARADPRGRGSLHPGLWQVPSSSAALPPGPPAPRAAVASGLPDTALSHREPAPPHASQPPGPWGGWGPSLFPSWVPTHTVGTPPGQWTRALAAGCSALWSTPGCRAHWALWQGTAGHLLPLLRHPEVARSATLTCRCPASTAHLPIHARVWESLAESLPWTILAPKGQASPGAQSRGADGGHSAGSQLLGGSPHHG